MSDFQPTPIVSSKEAHAPIAKKFAAFQKHRKSLLDILRNEHKSRLPSRPFNGSNSWRDLSELAKLYFWDEVRVTMSGPEHRKRLRQLATQLRKASGLTDRAMKDELAISLRVAFYAERGIDHHSTVLIEKDGSSALTRLVDEINEMATGLAKLETIARAAAAKDRCNRVGRPALLPRGLIQGLARVYRSNTGSKPGRGDGPFAKFAAEFALALGKKGFTRSSLVDAIQDAHLQFNPSWFDGKPPPS